MKRLLILAALLCRCSFAQAQELFVYTEPASNMPAHSIGLRATNWLMDERGAGRVNYHLIPELMWGVNKNLMIHAEGFISNRNAGLAGEGFGLYAKYRFFSRDTLYRHFRAAAFGRLSTNNAPVHQEEIMTNGHNSGYTLGLVATQLLHKQALSATLSFERALDNFRGNEFPEQQRRNALNLALSTGRLCYPGQYRSYRQTNINLMGEVLIQQLLGSNRRYVDFAPSVQLIFNSQTRVDLGYRIEVWSNMQRTAPSGLLIRVEHLMFGI